MVLAGIMITAALVGIKQTAHGALYSVTLASGPTKNSYSAPWIMVGKTAATPAVVLM